MKRALLLVLAIVFGLSLSAAQLKFAVGPQAGIGLLSMPKPLNDYYGFGYGFGGHVEMDVMKYFSGRFDLTYSLFPFDTDKFADELAKNSGVPAGSVTMSGLTLSDFSLIISGMGKLPTGTSITPYGVFGFGLHFLSSSDPSVTYQGQDVTTQAGLGKTEGTTKFGINFGAGAEMKVAKQVDIYLDIRYSLIFTEGESTGIVPIIIGANFWL